MRRRTAALPLTSLLLLTGLIGATTVVAGAMAVVTVTDVPAEPPAGAETAIGFTVMQHGVTAVSWPKITVVATASTTGDVIRAAATAEGPAGAYVASLVFPTEGAWTLTFDSTDLYMEGSAVVRVAPPVAAAPAETAPTPDVTPAVMALLGGLVVLVAALALRSRRIHDDAPVSART